MVGSRADSAVVHLVRAANGPGPLNRFLDSLIRHDAGRDYELVLVCKGFSTERLPGAYEALMESVPHRRVFVPDIGFDISAYFRVAELLLHEKLCFLNSFSRVLQDGWLEMLDDALASPGVGIVGATGSAETARDHSPEHARHRSRLTTLSPRYWYRVISFPPFPNYHLRSNGFYLAREVFLSLTRGALRTKRDVLRFESGRSSMTRQLAARRLQARVVGRDGSVFPPHAWASSRTFRSGDQENLLIEDNRTADYAMADAERRRILAAAAWGSPFSPGRPGQPDRKRA